MRPSEELVCPDPAPIGCPQTGVFDLWSLSLVVSLSLNCRGLLVAAVFARCVQGLRCSPRHSTTTQTASRRGGQGRLRRLAPGELMSTSCAADDVWHTRVSVGPETGFIFGTFPLLTPMSAREGPPLTLAPPREDVVAVEGRAGCSSRNHEVDATSRMPRPRARA